MRPSRRPTLLRTTGLILAAALACSWSVTAEEKEPIQARQDAMQAIGDAMKSLVGIVRGEAKFDAGVVASSAKTISDNLHAASELFPAGSDHGSVETWAKAEIWSHKPDFEGKLEAAHAAAIDLAKVSEESAYRPAFSKLGSACKACHELYRRPKD